MQYEIAYVETKLNFQENYFDRIKTFQISIKAKTLIKFRKKSCRKIKKNYLALKTQKRNAKRSILKLFNENFTFSALLLHLNINSLWSKQITFLV